MANLVDIQTSACDEMRKEMKKCVLIFAVCGSLFAAKKPDIVTTISPAEMVRTIAYNERDIPTVHGRIGYATVFVLPKSEKVVNILLGDKTGWSTEGSDDADGTNFAYLKPSKAGNRTNLNLVTASGNVYSFLLVEGEGNPDLKVFIDAKDPGMVKTAAGPPKWVLAAEMANKVEAAQREATAARGESASAREEVKRVTEEIRTKADADLAAFRAGFPSSLKYDYTWKKDRRGNKFGVRAIAHSDKFTYIWADPRETPTLYEIADNKPSLIEFAFNNGVYIVPKVLESACLTVGKAKMPFKREE